MVLLIFVLAHRWRNEPLINNKNNKEMIKNNIWDS
jgi:hypothetical protein